MCLSLCVKADDELRWFPRSYPCILGPHVIGEKGELPLEQLLSSSKLLCLGTKNLNVSETFHRFKSKFNLVISKAKLLQSAVIRF